ncbi:hypothetical protein MKW98_008241 [Papaver atlanticum]|uniref:Uncharacterized protein n=1 Tax=Papaver atlanticum TaxID=357466 RepID=A0AAD4RX55_9MAGN|nr:hypothetical protein MKW98_008241 [Papaver atlanticum]
MREKSKTVGKRKVWQGYEHTAVVALASCHAWIHLLLKILTRILTKSMAVLDNQHHQQQCCRGKKPCVVKEQICTVKDISIQKMTFRLSYFIWEKRFKGLVADGSRLLPLGQAVR